MLCRPDRGEVYNLCNEKGGGNYVDIVIATDYLSPGSCDRCIQEADIAMSGKAYKLLVLFLTWLIYITIGVFMFKAVEGDSGSTEKSNAGLRLKKLKEDVTKNYNMREDEFDDLVWQIQQANSSSAGPEWNYKNTLSFIFQLLTTIGKTANLMYIIYIDFLA